MRFLLFLALLRAVLVVLDLDGVRALRHIRWNEHYSPNCGRASAQTAPRPERRTHLLQLRRPTSERQTVQLFAKMLPKNGAAKRARGIFAS